jgi:hypothetical protein
MPIIRSDFDRTEYESSHIAPRLGCRSLAVLKEGRQVLQMPLPLPFIMMSTATHFLSASAEHPSATPGDAPSKEPR